MVVVDASVAFKWFDPTELDSPLAVKLYENHVNGIERIILPDLVFYELANAWSTKFKIDLKRIKNNLGDLEDAKFEIIPVNFASLKKAVKLSQKYKVSVYDAIYAVLAEQKGCNLFTADSKFVSQVKLPFIKLLT